MVELRLVPFVMSHGNLRELTKKQTTEQFAGLSPIQVYNDIVKNESCKMTYEQCQQLMNDIRLTIAFANREAEQNEPIPEKSEFIRTIIQAPGVSAKNAAKMWDIGIHSVDDFVRENENANLIRSDAYNWLDKMSVKFDQSPEEYEQMWADLISISTFFLKGRKYPDGNAPPIPTVPPR